MLVLDYLWQFIFSALKCKLLQLISALYPVGTGGCSIGFGGGETSRGYSMIFWEAVQCRDPGTLSVYHGQLHFCSPTQVLIRKKCSFLQTFQVSLKSVCFFLLMITLPCESSNLEFYTNIVHEHVPGNATV